MKCFLDTSALVKRYLEEPGTKKLQETLSEMTTLAIAIICPAETISALARGKRELRIGGPDYQYVKNQFFEDLQEMTVCDVTPTAYRHVIQIIENSSLRAMDAIHIGCAQDWGTDYFVSSDLRQLEVAQRNGLHVIPIS